MGFPDENAVVFTQGASVTEFFEEELISIGIETNEIEANPTL